MALRFYEVVNFEGFEQDDYVPNSNANNRNIEELISEYAIVRDCSISLFKYSFSTSSPCRLS